MEREGGEGDVYNGEWETFEVCRWQRHADPPIFCLSPLLFQILSNPPPSLSCHLQPPTPAVLSVAQFLWLNG